MKAISTLCALGLITLLLSVASISPAAVAIIDIGSSSSAGTSSNGAALGFSFATGANDILVTSVGLWDEGLDGFANAHEIQLSSWQFLLGVPMLGGSGALLLNGFRYVDLLIPILLPANGYYRIMATGMSSTGDNFRTSPLGLVFSPEIVSPAGDYEFEDIRGEVVRLVGWPDWVGPNFQYSIVPEPAPVALFTIAEAFCMRRRLSSVLQHRICQT